MVHITKYIYKYILCVENVSYMPSKSPVIWLCCLTQPVISESFFNMAQKLNKQFGIISIVEDGINMLPSVCLEWFVAITFIWVWECLLFPPGKTRNTLKCCVYTHLNSVADWSSNGFTAFCQCRLTWPQYFTGESCALMFIDNG